MFTSPSKTYSYLHIPSLYTLLYMNYSPTHPNIFDTLQISTPSFHPSPLPTKTHTANRHTFLHHLFTTPTLFKEPTPVHKPAKCLGQKLTLPSLLITITIFFMFSLSFGTLSHHFNVCFFICSLSIFDYKYK